MNDLLATKILGLGFGAVTRTPGLFAPYPILAHFCFHFTVIPLSIQQIESKRCAVNPRARNVSDHLKIQHWRVF
jgi:hypothetical protein